MRTAILFLLTALGCLAQGTRPASVARPCSATVTTNCTPQVSGAGAYVPGISGTFVTLSGDATSTATGGATTVQGLKGVPFCTGFTPTNGQLVQYTTASSPNPCYTAAAAGTAAAGGSSGQLQWNNSTVLGGVTKWTTNGTTTITGAATGVLDMSAAATLKVPVVAGGTASANGVVVYDSTAGITHVSTNGADSGVIAETSTDTTTSHVLHATAVTGLGVFSAIAAADLPGTLSSGTAITNAALTTPSVTTSIADSATGTATLGTAAHPFGGVYLGNAATNNIKLIGTSTGATQITLPDPATATGYALVFGTAPAGGKCVHTSGTAGLVTEAAADCGSGGGALTVNPQTGTTYSLQASDLRNIVTLNNASPITVTVPTGLGAGFECVLIQLGAGGVSLTASGTTLTTTATTAGVGQAITIFATAADTLVAYGNPVTPVPINQGGTNATTAAAALVSLLPAGTRVGDILYCSAYAASACTAWTLVAGNNSGTAWLQETSGGAPSWTVPGGGGNVSTSGSPAIHQLGVYASGTTVAGITVPATGTVLTGVAASDPAFSAIPTLGIQNTTQGTLTLAGSGANPGQLSLNIAGANAYPTVFVPGANGGTVTLTAPTSSGTLALFSQIPAAGANTTLSNLGTVALNADLKPGSWGATNLGTTALPFGTLTLTSSTSGQGGYAYLEAANADTSARTFQFPATSGTVAVSGGAMTNTALVTANGVAGVQTPAATATMDASGNVSTPGTVTAASFATSSTTFKASGTEGAKPTAPASSQENMWFDSTDHVIHGQGSGGTETWTGVVPLASRTAHYFSTYVDATGTQNTAAIAAADLPLVTVPYGGSGLATLTAHAVQVGEATSTPAQVGPNAATTYPLFSAGSSADPGFRAIATGDLPAIPLTGMATQAADTIVMNATGGSAAPTAVAMPTCTTGAVLYNTTTHAWSCVSAGGATAGNGISVSGTAVSWNPSDETIFALKTDFCTPNGTQNFPGWLQGTTVSGGTNAKVNTVTWPDFCGAVLTSTTTTNTGYMLTTGDTPSFANYNFPILTAHTGWTLTTRFALGQTTNTHFYVGFAHTCANGYCTPTNGFGVRYDTAASDTQFTYWSATTSTSVLASGTNADTNSHTVKITMPVTGEFHFSLDGGSDYCITSSAVSPACAGGNVTSAYVYTAAGFDGFIQYLQPASTAGTATIYNFNFMATGLAR